MLCAVPECAVSQNSCRDQTEWKCNDDHNCRCKPRDRFGKRHNAKVINCTSNKKITGYDTEFTVDGVMEINEAEEKTKRLDRNDVIDLVMAGDPIEFVYGNPAPGNTAYKGKMVITGYSESTDAEGEATYSLNCSGITKLTKEEITGV